MTAGAVICAAKRERVAETLRQIAALVATLPVVSPGEELHQRLVLWTRQDDLHLFGGQVRTIATADAEWDEAVLIYTPLTVAVSGPHFHREILSSRRVPR